MKILETERLYLRTWELQDSARLFEICSDLEVMLHIGDREPYQKIEEAENFLKWAIDHQKINGFSRWAVVEKSSEVIIGSCGFARLEKNEIELGYLFAKDFWGKGFATEAARGCLKYGLEKLNLKKIIALTDIDFKKTQNVLQKIGFALKGIEKIEENTEICVFQLNSDQ